MQGAITADKSKEESRKDFFPIDELLRKQKNREFLTFFEKDRINKYASEQRKKKAGK